MTQTDDSGSTAPRQPAPLYSLLPMACGSHSPIPGPTTWAMIVLRGCASATAALGHYEHLAQALGDADRRNVHNFWRSSRPAVRLWPPFYRDASKSMPRGGAREQIWQAHPFWSCAKSSPSAGDTGPSPAPS